MKLNNFNLSDRWAPAARAVGVFFVYYFILNTYQNKEFIGFRYIGTGLVLCGQETDLSTRSQDFFFKNV
ncbi:hypothetical protein B8A31_08805 [Dolosigranulum pigrum]|nr:hypothetical protein B8A31_08805 [Dolosigranulum pigrum]